MKTLTTDEFGYRLRILLIGQGPLTAKEICRNLNISQPTFSRFINKKVSTEILTLGRARATTYALRRKSTYLDDQYPLYQILSKGEVLHLADLIPVQPKGFFSSPIQAGFKEELYPDLPYFLDDLRPSGFLGRLVPKTHPDLGFPSDVRKWNSDDCLVYWSRFGWNLVGNFIVGDAAFKLYFEHWQIPEPKLKRSHRSKWFPILAEAILLKGEAGSSAGGEQPKFLIENMERSGPVLVKFSPPTRDEIGRRVADLLVCEHLAHKTLLGAGFPSINSEIVQAGHRIYLQNERFDRTQSRGRRGLISLAALGAQYGEITGSWTKISRTLLKEKKITLEIYCRIRWVEVFGELIGNSDMHPGNFSFYLDGISLGDPAPIYDMLPMIYYPSLNQLIDRKFQGTLPLPADVDLWLEVSRHAIGFWKRVAVHRKISRAFRKLAKENAKLLECRRKTTMKLSRS